MYRTFLILAVCAAIGFGGMTLAQHGERVKGNNRAKVLSQKDIVEKLDGKKTKVTTVELNLPPGHEGSPHRHPGPVFGYIIEGEYEWAIDDNPAKRLKAGDTFYEPAGCVHRVSKNPSKTDRARVLAVMLHPHDAKELAIPAKGTKKE